MSTLRILALDHYFDQDLSALSAHPSLQLRHIPYRRLRAPAVRIMGSEVAHGLHAYNLPANAGSRARYAAWLAREVRTLYLEWPFDVIVLPSDAFFYVRTLPLAAHRLGIPVVVVQKETTVSQATMETFSAEVAREAPFVSDFMTVCSERQREFWTRAGADPDRIEVTGQPRFDIYASSAPATHGSPDRVLFLTYALDAYVPGAGRGAGLHTWEQLREATETVLLDKVRGGACEVVVKCHPQQNHRAETERLSRLAGPLWEHGVSLADADADTRELIVAANTVVGFQTTALFEAVAARRTAVYAAWGEAYERLRDGLIRFDSSPADCIRHADSPEMLDAMVGDATPSGGGQPCTAWAEEALGPIDGQATDRVAARLATVAGAWNPTSERLALDRRRFRFAFGLLTRSLAMEAVWTAAIPVAKATGQQRRVALRRAGAREARSMATSTLRGRAPGPQ